MLDPIAARELQLTIENEASLYPQRRSIEENLLRRWKSGKYDHQLAPKLWRYWVDEGSRWYRRTHGGGPGAFSPQTRAYVAQQLADEYLAELRLTPQGVPKAKATKATKKKATKKKATKKKATSRKVEAGRCRPPAKAKDAIALRKAAGYKLTKAQEAVHAAAARKTTVRCSQVITAYEQLKRAARKPKSGNQASAYLAAQQLAAALAPSPDFKATGAGDLPTIKLTKRGAGKE